MLRAGAPLYGRLTRPSAPRRAGGFRERVKPRSSFRTRREHGGFFFSASATSSGRATHCMNTETESKASRAMLVAAFATIYLVWGSTYSAIRVVVETLP